MSPAHWPTVFRTNDDNVKIYESRGGPNCAPALQDKAVSPALQEKAVHLLPRNCEELRGAIR